MEREYIYTYIKNSLTLAGLLFLFLFLSHTSHAQTAPSFTVPSSTQINVPTVIHSNVIDLQWTPVTLSQPTTGYAIRIDDRGSNVTVASWDTDCNPLGAGDVCTRLGNTQTYRFTGQYRHSYQIWIHQVLADGSLSNASRAYYFTMIEPNYVPNCSITGGPSTIVLGSSGTFTGSYSARADLAGGMSAMRTVDGIVVWQPLSHFNSDVTSGSQSFTWTPTEAGTYTVFCRSWHDGIAECRGITSAIDRPPRYLCSGPNAAKTVTVVAPTPTVATGTWRLNVRSVCPSGAIAYVSNYAINWSWSRAGGGSGSGTTNPASITNQAAGTYQFTVHDNYNSRELSIRTANLPSGLAAAESNYVLMWNGALVPFGSYTIDVNTTAAACPVPTATPAIRTIPVAVSLINHSTYPVTDKIIIKRQAIGGVIVRCSVTSLSAITQGSISSNCTSLSDGTRYEVWAEHTNSAETVLYRSSNRVSFTAPTPPTTIVFNLPAPTSTPNPTATHTITPTRNATRTPTPSVTRVPTVTPSRSPTPTRLPTPTVTNTPTIPPNTPTTQPPTLTSHPSATPVIPTVTAVPSPTSVTPICNKADGDADCDGDTDSVDYAIWKSEFLTNNPSQGGNYRADFDNQSLPAILNGQVISKRVTMLDYAIWINHFLRTVNP